MTPGALQGVADVADAGAAGITTVLSAVSGPAPSNWREPKTMAPPIDDHGQEQDRDDAMAEDDPGAARRPVTQIAGGRLSGWIAGRAPRAGGATPKGRAERLFRWVAVLVRHERFPHLWPPARRLALAEATKARQRSAL